MSNQYEWPDLKIKIKTRAIPHGSMDYGTMSKVQSLIRREMHLKRVLHGGPLVCSDGPEKKPNKYDCVEYWANPKLNYWLTTHKARRRHQVLGPGPLALSSKASST